MANMPHFVSKGALLTQWYTQIPSDSRAHRSASNGRNEINVQHQSSLKLDHHDSRHISIDLQLAKLLSTYMYRSQTHRQHDTQEATAWTSRYKAGKRCMLLSAVSPRHSCLPSRFLLLIGFVADNGCHAVIQGTYCYVTHLMTTTVLHHAHRSQHCPPSSL